MLRIGSRLRSTQICTFPRNQSSLIARAKEMRTQLKKSSEEVDRPTKELSPIPRHGPGDACIILNVGGQEFHTLRSTVFSNKVLAEHVVRAESNKEITKAGAVFIDRDPEHFGFILKYLRNRMERMDAFPKSGVTQIDATAKLFMKRMAGSKSHVSLPDNEKTLRDLYVEVSFYEISELQTELGSCTMSGRIVKLFNKNASNPLEAGAKLVTRIRTLFLTAGAAGTTMVLWIQSELNWVLTRIGIRQDEDEASAEKVIAGN